MLRMCKSLQKGFKWIITHIFLQAKSKSMLFEISYCQFTKADNSRSKNIQSITTIRTLTHSPLLDNGLGRGCLIDNVLPSVFTGIMRLGTTLSLAKLKSINF